VQRVQKYWLILPPSSVRIIKTNNGSCKYAYSMKIYYLVDELHVVSQTIANSLTEAIDRFEQEGLPKCDVMTEDDFVIELELNAYENMSHEW